MKYWYIAAAALLLAVLTGGCVSHKKANPDSADIDGGVRHHSDTNAPKVIHSTEIVYFYCKFSTTDLCREDSSIAGNVFTLEADRNRCVCTVRYPTEQKITFSPDSGFFTRLHNIISTYDFARYNGQYYTVSGLPPDIGMTLDIQYTSGEAIQAQNNQDCFLPLAAMEALVTLFQEN